MDLRRSLLLFPTWSLLSLLLASCSSIELPDKVDPQLSLLGVESVFLESGLQPGKYGFVRCEIQPSARLIFRDNESVKICLSAERSPMSGQDGSLTILQNTIRVCLWGLHCHCADGSCDMLYVEKDCRVLKS